MKKNALWSSFRARLRESGDFESLEPVLDVRVICIESRFSFRQDVLRRVERYWRGVDSRHAWTGVRLFRN